MFEGGIVCVRWDGALKSGSVVEEEREESCKRLVGDTNSIYCKKNWVVAMSTGDRGQDDDQGELRLFVHVKNLRIDRGGKGFSQECD